MISFKDVDISYGKNIVIRGMSFNVDEGEVYGIIGPNGSGKTTLLRAMLGIINADRGQVLINGLDPIKTKPKIASVFETSLGTELLRLTPKEDLKFYASLYDVDITNERIHEILKLVDLHPDGRLYTFSRGMWQKLYIARALIPDFPLIVLDEPWLGLDVTMQRKTVEIFRDLRKTIVLAAHEMPLVERVCSRILIINNGKKVVEGTVDELLNRIEWRYEVKVSGKANEVDGVKPKKRDNLNVYYVKDLKKFLEKLDVSKLDKIDVTPISLEEAYLYLLNEKVT